jgi:hypothetical protein
MITKKGGDIFADFFIYNIFINSKIDNSVGSLRAADTKQ